MKRVVTENDLDVNKPQKLAVPTEDKKASKAVKEPQNFETMLHAAAGACDQETVKFLIGRGQ